MLTTKLYAQSIESFTAIATGDAIETPSPVKSFAIQVVGVQVAATSWTVLLEGSLDGINFDTILTHTTTTGNAKIVWSGTNLFPSKFFRTRVTAVALGSAASIRVFTLGMQ